MGWYDKLMNNKHTNNYPDNIQSIQIIDTQLNKNKEHFILVTQVHFNYLHNQQIKTKQINENFVFDLNKNNNFIKIDRLESKEIDAISTPSTFDKDHYQYRNFAYKWLAYLNGNTALFENKINNTKHQLQIGAKQYQGTLSAALSKHKEWMGVGQYLLRSIEVIKNTKDSLRIVLIIRWNGITNKGKLGIAKIEQTVDMKKEMGGNYQLLNIKERLLLPDMGAWDKLTC
ncbi:hypothetical protein CRYPD_1369 [uncultured Candidatus Thioglobus sp.]|nr:hypothetical protein CRYPD_1369 [uncultured Candidatus Thioglobus sp.]